MTSPGNATHYGCGHPREGNTRFGRCALCDRVRQICKRQEREQYRLNERRYTLGQLIAKGIVA